MIFGIFIKIDWPEQNFDAFAKSAGTGANMFTKFHMIIYFHAATTTAKIVFRHHDSG